MAKKTNNNENSQKLPLMRKSIAVWLIDNTSLTFEQIANFCGMHELEIQGMADGEVADGIVGINPIINGQLTREMITACEKDHNKQLELKEQLNEIIVPKKRKAKYIPIARRKDKPDAISFLIKYYPDISDAQIKKLIGTTNKMIDSIRNRTHWNMKEIRPKDPVLLGLCSQSTFNSIISDIKRKEDK